MLKYKRGGIMNNKERYLLFIKYFNNIKTKDILKTFNLSSSSFYTYEYSLENMQQVSDEMKKQIKEIYPNIKDDKINLDTKEKIVDFIKDIKEIGINKICNQLKIDSGALYTYRVSDSKYELIINEIKKQLDEVYKKYSK